MDQEKLEHVQKILNELRTQAEKELVVLPVVQENKSSVEGFQKIGPAILEKMNGIKLVGRVSYEFATGFFYLIESTYDSGGHVVGHVAHIFPRTSVAQITDIDEEDIETVRRSLNEKKVEQRVAEVQIVPVYQPMTEHRVEHPNPPIPQHEITAAESKGRPGPPIHPVDHLGIRVFKNENLERDSGFGGSGSFSSADG